MVYVATLDYNKFLYVSPASYRILGHSSQEFIEVLYHVVIELSIKAFLCWVLNSTHALHQGFQQLVQLHSFGRPRQGCLKLFYVQG